MADGSAGVWEFTRIDNALTMFQLRRVTRLGPKLASWWSRAAVARSVLLVGAVVGGAFLIEWLRTDEWQAPSWTSVGLTLLALFVLGILVSATLVQRRIVIETFIDHTQAPDAKGDPMGATGIPALVRQELNRLRQVYDPASRRLAVDVSAIGARADSGRANLEVSGGDIGDVIRGAITADSKITAGFLSIPVAPVAAFLGRVIQGPRLSGSLHRTGTTVALAAQLQRRGASRTWRLEEPIGDDPAAAVAALSNRLAGQVTADLLHGPDLAAATIEPFHRGLTAYAEALRLPSQRGTRLRSARDCFLDAAATNPDFAWASFNLGLVHQELAAAEENPAFLAGAEDGFDRAITCDPLRWEFRHARCVVAIELHDVEEAQKFGREALQLAPTALASAKSCYQVGRAHEADDDQLATLARWRRATRWSRRALLHTDLGGGDRADAARTAGLTLMQLALACARYADGQDGRRAARWRRLARRALDTAADLTPDDPDVPTALAAVELAAGHDGAALRAARRATVLRPDGLEAWAAAAEAAARTDDAAELRNALSGFFWSPTRALQGADGTAPDGTVAPMTDLLTRLRRATSTHPLATPTVSYLERVQLRWALLAKLDHAGLEAHGSTVPALGTVYVDLARWERAMSDVRLAFRAQLSAPSPGAARTADPQSAETFTDTAKALENAIGLLEHDHVADIAYLALRPAIAHCLRRAAGIDGNRFAHELWRARDHLLRATQEAPFDPLAQQQLGLVQMDIGNLEAAEQALLSALDCQATGRPSRWPPYRSPFPWLPFPPDPDRPALLSQLASVLLQRAGQEVGATATAMREQAVAYLLEAAGDPQTAERSWPLLFRLGRAYRDLRRYTEAAEAFVRAWQGTTTEHALCALMAAESYFSADRFASCAAWGKIAMDRVDDDVAAGRTPRTVVGRELDFGLPLAGIVSHASALIGRVALERDDVKTAVAHARKGLRQRDADDFARFNCWLLAADIGRHRAKREAGRRRALLRKSLARYRKAEALWIDAELAEKLADVLLDLAGGRGLVGRTLVEQAEERLLLAERLDQDHVRDRQRAKVRARLSEMDGAPTSV